MRVVHDARDVLIDHFESSNRIWPPLISVQAQHDDCQLAVHFCNCQLPWHSLRSVAMLFPASSSLTACARLFASRRSASSSTFS